MGPPDSAEQSRRRNRNPVEQRPDQLPSLINPGTIRVREKLVDGAHLQDNTVAEYGFES
jgi:hypothetical protein